MRKLRSNPHKCPRARSEKGKLPRRTLGRCGFCSCAFGDRFESDRLPGGQITKRKTDCGRDSGICGATGEFIYAWLSERACKANRFEWGQRAGFETGVEWDVFCV